MPVIVAEAEPKRRRMRPGVLLALLLSPPLMLVALFVSASMRPLQLGPLTVITTTRVIHNPRGPWFRLNSGSSRAPRLPTHVTMEKGRFLVKSPIHATFLHLGDVAFDLRWFHGKPALIDPEILRNSNEFYRRGVMRPAPQR